MLYTSLVWEQHRAFQAESMLGASISHCLWEFAMLMLWQISIFTHLVNKKMAWCWFNLQFFNVRVRVHVFPGHPDFIWGYLPIHMLCSLFYGASHHNLTHLKHSLWKKFSFFVISFCYISIFLFCCIYLFLLYFFLVTITNIFPEFQVSTDFIAFTEYKQSSNVHHAWKVLPIPRLFFLFKYIFYPFLVHIHL